MSSKFNKPGQDNILDMEEFRRRRERDPRKSRRAPFASHRRQRPNLVLLPSHQGRDEKTQLFRERLVDDLYLLQQALDSNSELTPEILALAKRIRIKIFSGKLNGIFIDNEKPTPIPENPTTIAQQIRPLIQQCIEQNCNTEVDDQIIELYQNIKELLNLSTYP